MKTSLLNLAIFSLCLVIVSSCSPPKEQPPKIGVSIGPADGRWDKDKDYLLESLESKGMSTELRASGGDHDQQLKDIDDLVSSGVDVLIVIAANPSKMSQKVREVRDEGIKVIAYDRLILDCELDFYISFDNIKVGELQADYLSKIVPKGNFIILGGSPDDPNSKFLRLGQMNVLQPLITKGDVKVVMEEYVDDWNSELAYGIVNGFLKRNNVPLHAVISSSDDLSVGAIRALEEHGVAGDVYVSGQDAREEACKQILKGNQTMTVYKFIQSLAQTASQVAVKLANDQEVPNAHITVNNGAMMVPSILLPSMIVVNKENLRTTVIADGYLDEAKVYGSSM